MIFQVVIRIDSNITNTNRPQQIKQSQYQQKMHSNQSRQSLTSRQSFPNSHTKKPKSIKSIRIVDKQNHPPYTNPVEPNNKQHAYTARSPSPHEFSFKKQYPTSCVPQSPNQYLLKDKLFCQQQEIKKLERMLKSMTGKVENQQQEYGQLRTQYEEWMREMKENAELKREICELKDLMKELLIEKENDRMMVFYQDC